MNSFELNKILGAILGTCLIMLALNIGAGAIFAPEKPAKPGYNIAVKEQGEGEKAGAAKDWPKDGTRLSSRLTRVATHLRVIGINVRRDRRRATGRRFTIRRELLDREGKIASPASPASQDNTTNGLGGDTMTFANPRPAPPASRPPSQCNPLTNPKIDASDAGDADFHTRSGSPSNDGIPDFLRRCDHCGQPSRTVEPLAPYDCDGRQVLLHPRCEGPWFDSAGTRQ